MKKHDRMSACFLIVLAAGICEESIRLGPGSLRNPGPGLLPLGCGLLLGLLSLLGVVRPTAMAGLKDSEAGPGLLWKPGTKWRRLIFVLVSLMAYAFLIDSLGFHLITFLWIGFVCRWVGGMRWRSTLMTSAMTTLLAYLLFEYFLNVRFPSGILGV